MPSRWATIPNAGPSPFKFKGAQVPGLNYMSPDRNMVVPGMAPGQSVGQYQTGFQNIMGSMVPTYSTSPTPGMVQNWSNKANSMLPAGTQARYGAMPTRQTVTSAGEADAAQRGLLASMPTRGNAIGKGYVLPHPSTPGGQAINPEREQDWAWDKVSIGGKKGFGWGLMNLAGAGLGLTGFGGALASKFLPAGLNKALPYISGLNTAVGAVRGKGRNLPGTAIGLLGSL